MTVRPAQKSDFQAWLEMREKLWPECPRKDHIAEISAWLGDLQSYPSFIAELETGERVGFLEASFCAHEEYRKDQRILYVEGWFVKEGFRRMGVGRKLIEHLCAYASTRKRDEIFSDAETANQVSIEAHEKLGFRKFQEKDGALIFRKTLQGK